jgi:hypothetical protein
VAGYSRLMGLDEEGTHERLKAHLRGLEFLAARRADNQDRARDDLLDGRYSGEEPMVCATLCWRRQSRANPSLKT